MARHENCSPEQRSGKRLSFKVSQVEVLIQNESGVVLEQGVAALDDENAGFILKTAIWGLNRRTQRTRRGGVGD